MVDLPTLVQLELAAGRYQDFADVVNLARANHLDEPFGDRLAPSVRADFIECIQQMQCDGRKSPRRCCGFHRIAVGFV